MRIHGKYWGLRFETTGKLKGRELRNAQLPPAKKPDCASLKEAPQTLVEILKDAAVPETKTEKKADELLKEYVK